MTLIAHRFLFDFELTLHHRAIPPKVDGSLNGWHDDDRLPSLSGIDDRRDFADVFACWNESGLYFGCEVRGKKEQPRCNPKAFWQGDNVRLCTDMRDARANKRATKFCQQFFFLPKGGGRRGDEPIAGTHKIRQAREDAPPIDEKLLVVAADVQTSGYVLTAHVPAVCLSGFDPAQHPRIGFYFIIEDSELGQQYLTIGDELMWFVDPSTWATAVLARADKGAKPRTARSRI